MVLQVWFNSWRLAANYLAVSHWAFSFLYFVHSAPGLAILPCLYDVFAPRDFWRFASDHGVTFEMARDVFKDPFAIELLNDREDYGEERHVIIGMGSYRLLFVALHYEG